MTIQEINALEANELRLLASVMQAEETVESSPEEDWEIYFAALAQEHGVERETSERLAGLQNELTMLFDAGCNAEMARWMTKLEGGAN